MTQSRKILPIVYSLYTLADYIRTDFCRRNQKRFIPRLHDQADSTIWLYVSWTSQLGVCSMLAGCLLDVCSMYARCLLCFMDALYLLDVCSMFARSYKQGITISEVTADWYKLMTPQRFMRLSVARVSNNWIPSEARGYSAASISHVRPINLYPVVRKLPLSTQFPSRWG